MSFELLPHLTAFVVLFSLMALAAVVLTGVVATDFVRANRGVRLARRQSIPTYYGRLILSH